MRLLTGALAMAAVLSGAAPDPLDRERWHHRVLLVFADRPDDPALRAQREALAPVAQGLQTRDVRVIEVLGDAAPEGFDGAALRAAFPRGSGFGVILVGKDGGAKLRRAAPLSAATLFATIDSMPMAKQEAAARKEAARRSAR